MPVVSNSSPNSTSKNISSSNVFTNMFTPRSYQVELLEFALRQNTIICVNTASGKRFLSTMLIREMIANDEFGDGYPKLAILLLNEESVVKSQGELLQDHLNVNVAFCLSNKCSNLSKNEWTSIMKSHQVLTITPKLLVSAFEADGSLSKLVDIIIFDECHLILNEEHSYRKIMQILDEHEVDPNILGLTTSLLHENSTADSLKDTIMQMEKLLHSTAQTATDLIALDRHSLMKPTENIILSADAYKSERETTFDLASNIQQVLEDALGWLNNCQLHSNVRLHVVDWEIGVLTDEVKGNCQSEIHESQDSVQSSDCRAQEVNHDSMDPGNNEKEFASSSGCNRKAVLENEDVCTTPKSLLQEVLIVLDILGPWCVYKLVELIIKQLHKVLLGVERRLKQAILDNNDEEPTSGMLIWQKMLLQYVNTKLHYIYAMCQQHMGSQKPVDLQFVSPKVHRLLQVLKEMKPITAPDSQQSYKYNDRNESDYVSWWQDSDADDEDEEVEGVQEKKSHKSSEDSAPSPLINTLCGIVFVEEKYVAMMLHRLLREVSKEERDLKHVTSSHLGSSSENVQSGFDSTSVDKSKQEEVLRKFRSHETNLLITTSSLEDCAHIPKCNLVVRFDAPRSYRAYAQSKSRARASSSAYVMLIRDSEKCEFMEKLQEYKRIEQVLQGPMSLDRDDVMVGDDDVGDDYDDVIMPYSTGSATVSMKNAIRIINRYCSRLPSDPFTHLTPRSEVTEEPGGGYYDNESSYRCILQLPINSHLREPIQGHPMPSVRLAQQAVAVEACERLHLCGELDDNLMPIGKETVKYAEELDPWKPEQTNVLGRPGSTKRRQTYIKDIPRALTQCLPSPNKPAFIYEIVMRLTTPLPQEVNFRNRKTYYPEDTSRCFGILTAKPLPEIPGSPIFTRSGEEMARLRLCKSFISLTEQQIKLIKSFHRYIFSDMLRVDRVPLYFKPEAAENQLLIVSLNKVRGLSEPRHLDIDWSFMVKTDLKRRSAEKIKKDPWYSHKMSEKNKSFTFSRQTYEDAVVVRNYGNCDQSSRYYVAEIKDDLNPSSPFPSTDYMTYKHYYEAKYAVDIRCSDQPLLDVDHTPSRLNLLTPRHTTKKGKSGSREKKTKPKNPVIFVPELCDAHPIPASLWRKAVCIPSVLYRVGQLLIGEELRRDIATKSGIVSERPPLGYTWPNIHFSYDDDLELNSSVDIPFFAPETREGVAEKAERNGVNEGEKEKQSRGDDPGLSQPNTEARPALVSSEGALELKHPQDNESNVSSPSDDSEAYYSDDYEFCFMSDGEKERHTKKRKKKASPQPDRSLPIPETCLQEYLKMVSTSPEDIGPGPEVLLQALTLSNASDGYNLERMEMLGDSFLKHAVTVYLYCTYPDAHEGKLSYMRSKKVSNYNLYRIGRAFGVAGKMTAHIFDPIVNWLPAGYTVGSPGDNDEDCEGLSDDEVEIGVWTGVPGANNTAASSSNPAANRHFLDAADPSSEQYEENEDDLYDEDEIRMIDGMLGGCLHRLGGSARGSSMEKKGSNGMMGIDIARMLSGHASMHFTDKAALRQSTVLNKTSDDFVIDTWTPLDSSGKPLSSNDPLLLELHTQHSLSDKSIADSVEALLGAYLLSCGHRAAQLLLCHLGLVVLPKSKLSPSSNTRTIDRFGHLVAPSNHFTSVRLPQAKVDRMLIGLRGFEKKIKYQFRNKAYLLQAFTHASYYYNTVTDCYQRLEFLGDAVLDFLITRHLCADDRQHSPGALTDLRCALVNNTIFASLAVRYDFHKYFKSISPELQKVVEDFVSYQKRQEEAQGMDAQLMRHYGEQIVSPEELDQSFMDVDEDEEETEDVEVPKALGDIFESVAGAIFMDSGMDLDAVWNVYSVMMLPLIEKFSSCVPRSPVRELLEMEPETAKFSCAEKRFDGKIRVTVEIIGKGHFKGVGRSYRIAKSAAARRALRFLKRNYC